MPGSSGDYRYDLRVAVESFRPHWERVQAIGQNRFQMNEGSDHYKNMQEQHGESKARFMAAGTLFDKQAFCEWTGLTNLEYEQIMRCMRCGQTVAFTLCDRVLTRAGYPYVVATLYTVTPMGQYAPLVEDDAA